MNKKIPRKKFFIDLTMHRQPTDTSCGPTCLNSVYRHYGLDISIARLIGDIPSVEGGGTLAVMLGIDALKRGFAASLYTYNLRVFDPTWFYPQKKDLIPLLKEQLIVRESKKIRQAIQGYLDYVMLGGQIHFEDLTPSLISNYLRKGKPVLTGLSSTFLYRGPREIPDTNKDDPVRGSPAGHFVVIFGFDKNTGSVYLADPLDPNPMSPDHYYKVEMSRLINAILLGVLTYDGNLLVIEPKSKT